MTRITNPDATCITVPTDPTAQQTLAAQHVGWRSDGTWLSVPNAAGTGWVDVIGGRTVVLDDAGRLLDVCDAAAADTLYPQGSTAVGTLTQHPTYPGLLVFDVTTTPPTNYPPEVTIANVLGEVLTATATWTATDPNPGDTLTYSVAWGDGNTTSSATSPAVHTYAASGTYTVTVTASDGTDTGNASQSVTVASPSYSAYHAAVIADGPIVYYPLDDTSSPSVDATGATTATSTTWPTFGAIGIGDGTHCCDFPSGGSAFIDIGQPSALNNITGNFTFEAIVQPDSNSETKTIVTRDDGTSARSYAFRRVSQTFSFQSIPGTVVALSSTTNYPAGSIYHVAFVRSGTTLTCYVNGAADGTTTLSANLGAPNTPHQIGAKPAGVMGNVDGRVAGVAIYTKALTLTQIQAHHAAIGT